MKISFLGIVWAASEHVYAFAGALLFCVVLFYAARKVLSHVRLLVAPRWQAQLFMNFSSKKVIIKSILLGIGAIFLSLALLRPQWGKREQVVEQEGRELLVALDISRSMLAVDIKPNRLAFAKSKIKKLVKLLGAQRVGLLVFSGNAFVQCPLTRDTAAFNLFLDNVDVESLSSGTTSIAKAIEKSLQTFASLPTRKNKILVVCTDGEDFSTGLSQLKEDAKKAHMHIFTYGVGTLEGAPVPLIDDEGVSKGYQKDEQGKIVFSCLNSGILQALSRESGGKYIQPTQDDADMKALIAHVEKYEKERFEDKEVELEEERYPWFLAVAFLCLLSEWLL